MPFAGYDPATNPMNTTEWAFPLAEVFHLVGFALLIGTIALVSLRLLGLGMKRQTSAELQKATAPFQLIGLVVVLISGFLIFSSDPGLYLLESPVFHLKMTTLVIAILFNWTIHKKTALLPDPGTTGVVVGVISLLLWGSLIVDGIMIAFY